jgi:tripartite-type tricarboxylate transporter receptor subunit TctC
LRGHAVTSPKRWPIVPDLPTMNEAGVPGFIITPWEGIIAPAGVSKTVLSRLNTEFNTAFETPKIKDFYGSLGIERVGDPALVSRTSDCW